MKTLEELNEFGKRYYGDRFLGCEVVFKRDVPSALECRIDTDVASYALEPLLEEIGSKIDDIERDVAEKRGAGRVLDIVIKRV